MQKHSHTQILRPSRSAVHTANRFDCLFTNGWKQYL